MTIADHQHTIMLVVRDFVYSLTVEYLDRRITFDYYPVGCSGEGSRRWLYKHRLGQHLYASRHTLHGCVN